MERLEDVWEAWSEKSHLQSYSDADLLGDSHFSSMGIMTLTSWEAQTETMERGSVLKPNYSVNMSGDGEVV